MVLSDSRRDPTAGHNLQVSSTCTCSHAHSGEIVAKHAKHPAPVGPNAVCAVSEYIEL